MYSEKGSSKDFITHCSEGSKPMPVHLMSGNETVAVRISCVAASD